MIRFLLIFFILGITIFGYSQNNLVPNHSFENINYCPPYYDNILALQNWQNPTNGSPNIFNVCNTTNAGIPDNTFGNQYAYEGNGYIGLLLYLINTHREYFQVELMQPLVSNTKYKVSFYVSLADSSRWGINNIGIYFSQDSFFVNTSSSLNYSPQILSSIIITDTSMWTLISESYQAIGGEKFITIGNFMDNANTDTLCINPNYNPIYNSSYYYIDNVFVGLDTTVDISEKVKVESEKLVVYLNPASGNLIIDYTLINSGTFELFDVTGKCLITEMLNTSNNQLTLSVKEIPNGMYYYRVTNSKGIINTGKLTIIK